MISSDEYKTVVNHRNGLDILSNQYQKSYVPQFELQLDSNVISRVQLLRQTNNWV